MSSHHAWFVCGWETINGNYWQYVMPCDAQDLVCLQENERTKDLIIEQRFHRAIIGQKGEKIKEVRDKFPEVS